MHMLSEVLFNSQVDHVHGQNVGVFHIKQQGGL